MSRMTVRDVQKAMDNHAKADIEIRKIVGKFLRETQASIKKNLLEHWVGNDET